MSGRISHPTCPRPAEECRITMKTEMGAYIPWTPIYDGQGLITNSDPNHATTTYDCAVCGESWTSEDMEPSATYQDPGPPAPPPAPQ